MGDKSAIAFPFFRGLCCVTGQGQGNAAVQVQSRVAVSQPQPPQVEQLPEQEAEGSCTVIGSPPFIAVLMMASI